MDSVPFEFCQRVCSQDVIFADVLSDSKWKIESAHWKAAYHEHRQRTKYCRMRIEGKSDGVHFSLLIGRKFIKFTAADIEKVKLPSSVQLIHVKFYYLSSVHHSDYYQEVRKILVMFRLFLNNFTLYVFQSFFTVAMLNDLPVNSIKKVSLPIVEEYMEPLVLAVAELPNLRELDIKCWAKLPSSSVVAALENLLLRDQLSFFDVSEDVKFSASFFEEFLTKRLGSKKWSLNHLHINYNVCDLHKDFQRPRSPGNTAWSLTWEHDMGTINVNCPSTKKKKKCTIC